MKILHLCVKRSHSKGFGGGVGGYSTYTDRLHELEDDFNSEGIKNIFVGVTHPWGWRSKILEFFSRFLIDVLNCAYAVIIHRPKILHVHGLYWRSSYREIFFVLIARLIGAKVLYEARAGDLISCLKAGVKYRIVLKAIFYLSHLVTIQGQKDMLAMRDYLSKTEIRVAPNFLSKIFESEVVSISEKNKYAVAFVGAVGYRKKCDLILALARRRPAFSFNLYGSVEESFKTEKIPQNVTLHGRVTHDKLITELAVNTYFIFMSNMSGEGQPNALIEGISRGLIPITLDVGYIKEVVPSSFAIFEGNLENVEEVLAYFDEATAQKTSLDIFEEYREEKASKKQVATLLDFYRDITC